MATIDIKRNHQLGLDVAKTKAEELANGMKDKLGIQWRWDGNNIRFDAPSGAAKGAKGQVTVDASFIRVEIDLPLLLRPMKGMVEGKVTEKLDRAIGSSCLPEEVRFASTRRHSLRPRIDRHLCTNPISSAAPPSSGSRSGSPRARRRRSPAPRCSCRRGSPASIGASRS